VNAMTNEQPKNPLHGITLKDIIEDLVASRKEKAPFQHDR